MAGLAPSRTNADRPALLVVAAPIEARAVLRGLGIEAKSTPGFRRWEALAVRPGFELLVTGVGKACAAGAVAMALDPARHRCVINIGIAGALPAAGPERDGPEGGAEWGAELLDVVLADSSVYGDEGIETPDGFEDVASMGFSPAPPGFEAMGLTVPADPALLAALLSAIEPIADRVGPIATVSTCAGTDLIARRIATRTGAVAEAMEGAAVGFTARCLSASRRAPVVPFIEARVISNTTGDRGAQRWDMAGAMERLSGLSNGLARALET